MQIKVLFDSQTLDKSLFGGWGISFLVGKDLLFDTGERGDWLLNNMEKMNVSPKDLKAIVISHDHWDHTSGLWQLLKHNRQVKVYACPNFSLDFKENVKTFGAELIEVANFTQVAKNIYTTGEIAGKYIGEYIAEQAVLVESEKGLVVLTGCAHPGIITILERVKDNLGNRIYMVLGGFHLIEEDRRIIELIISKFCKLGVEKVGPTHCSGKETEKLFKEEYKDNFIPVKAGMKLEV
jgi:7,8-dihydropterin-6-yl-methyl-4-(beta-D-ribofuranosyl)aminobenzene 5'-phosphate synthase